MRKLLAICDACAAENDIVFNARKSKFLVVSAAKRRLSFEDTCDCNLYVGGSAIENVCRYSHLGHIITSSFSESDDVTYRRNCLVGQANNVLCFFNKLDVLVRLNLFKSYCSSMYDCELWALNNNDNVDLFCVAWRKTLRRVLNLPYNTHSNLLLTLTVTIPILDEICKRSELFITSCLSSRSRLVRSASWHSVVIGKFSSPLGVMLCKAVYVMAGPYIR
jgi:hypothetical protein